jgi:tRNA (cmo5U34)-methyltransferase
MKPPVPDSAARYFGEMVQSYDSLIARAVPRYGEMTDELMAYLPTAPRRVLELGCGTGNLSLRLAARFPDASITFVDAAPEMIEITRARLDEALPQAARRATFVLARFEELSMPDATYDLVTSAISLHHVREKAPLYRALRQAIAPGGTFRFADQHLGNSEANQSINWARWLDFCRSEGQCTPDELESLLHHAAAHDHYTPLAEHFRMLEHAGFTGVDCVWRSTIWGIITADVAPA